MYYITVSRYIWMERLKQRASRKIIYDFIFEENERSKHKRDPFII